MWSSRVSFLTNHILTNLTNVILLLFQERAMKTGVVAQHLDSSTMNVIAGVLDVTGAALLENV